MPNTFHKCVTIIDSKEPSWWKPLGVSFLVTSRNDTHIRINLLIEIRFTIDFIISNFLRALSYPRLEWILYAICFIYYDCIDGAAARQVDMPHLTWLVDPSKVFITEDLTRTRQYVLWKARCAKRNKRIKDCWSNDGQILVKDNAGKVNLIKSPQDVIAYDP